MPGRSTLTRPSRIAPRAVRQQTPLEPTAGTAVVVYHQRRARIPEFDVGQLATVENS